VTRILRRRNMGEGTDLIITRIKPRDRVGNIAFGALATFGGIVGVSSLYKQTAAETDTLTKIGLGLATVGSLLVGAMGAASIIRGIS
jgi:hypothetical protein